MAKMFSNVKRIYIIPKQKIEETFSKINNTSLTFGVHKEDTNNHPLRDSLQNKPLHKSLYGNTKKISNAELLKKTETGFITDLYVNNRPKQIEVAPRPILVPLIKTTFKKESTIRLLKQGIKKQLSFKSPNSINNSLQYISLNLSTAEILNFVKNRGGKYWSIGAKHNSPYVAMVKYLESLGESGIGNVYNSKTQTIKNISQWENANLYKAGDLPLQDSLDLIKSIKAKVNTK